MPRPDSTPVSLTPEIIKGIIEHARYAKDEWGGIEACGLIFGRDGVGSRGVRITNVHSQPTQHFLMHEQAVIGAMNEADETLEELVAVYHSHPASAPIPSEGDKSTPHIGPGSPVYLIVGLEDDQHPLLSAWRMDLPFLGQPRASQVAVHASADGQPYIALAPLTPWCLTPGNKVALTYQRPGHPKPRTIICEITGASGDIAAPGKVTLDLKSSVGTDPKRMLVERVQACRVLRESPQAGRVRQRAAAYGRALADVADSGGINDISKYSTFIAAAFPTWLNHVEGE